MYTKSQTIKSFKPGEKVNDIFVVKEKRPVEQYKNGYKFELKIGDATSTVMLKYWGTNDEYLVKNLYESISKGNVIHVSNGKVNEWNNALEISCNFETIIGVLKHDEYQAEDFIKKSEKNIELMWQELNKIIDNVENEEIKKVLFHFFKNEDFASKYKIWPAAMYIHHGWIGGLLEHSLNVAKICIDIHKIHFKLDKDLMIAGALTHDMGKLKEFSLTSFIDMTKEGKLLGHLNIGLDMLNDAYRQLNTSDELRLKLNHIVLTHMGEYGSTKQASFPEALAVHLADDIDGKLNHMTGLKENADTDEEFIYTKHYGDLYLK